MFSVLSVLAAVFRGRITPKGDDRMRQGAPVWSTLLLPAIVAGLAMGIGVYAWPAASKAMVAFADPGAAAVFATALTPVSYLLLTPVGWFILALRPGLDPRNVAVAANAVVALAFVTLASGSLVIDPGPGRLALLLVCVLVSGAAGGIVPAMLTTTVTHLQIRPVSAPAEEQREPVNAAAVFFGVWASSFGSAFYVVAKLADSLGVHSLLWILAAVMVATIAVPRLLPEHPDAGNQQPPWKQQWAGARRELNTGLARTAVCIVALQGFAIAARFGPLSPVAEEYAKGGAPLAANAAEWVGIGIVAVALPQAIIGNKMARHLKLILQISGMMVALGCALGLLPALFGDQIGGITTVFSTLVVEAGHDICLMVMPAVLAELAGARPALAWQFAAKYVSSLALVLVVLPVVGVFFGTVGQNYALSFLGAVAGFVSWVLVPRFIGSYEDLNSGRQTADATRDKPSVARPLTPVERKGEQPSDEQQVRGRRSTAPIGPERWEQFRPLFGATALGRALVALAELDAAAKRVRAVADLVELPDSTTVDPVDDGERVHPVAPTADELRQRSDGEAMLAFVEVRGRVYALEWVRLGYGPERYAVWYRGEQDYSRVFAHRDEAIRRLLGLLATGWYKIWDGEVEELELPALPKTVADLYRHPAELPLALKFELDGDDKRPLCGSPDSGDLTESSALGATALLLLLPGDRIVSVQWVQLGPNSAPVLVVFDSARAGEQVRPLEADPAAAIAGLLRQFRTPPWEVST